MSDIKSGFSLVFAENLKRDTNLSTTPQMSFDDLGDFIEERNRIRRALDNNGETQLKVDYSNLSNHVFFDSAVSKITVAKNRILTRYPFNGTNEEVDAFFLTGSDYEAYLFSQWPTSVGFVNFDGTTQYITASDTDGKLQISTGSFTISTNINPFFDGDIHSIVCMGSGTVGVDGTAWGLTYSGSGGSEIVSFVLFSGAYAVDVSASYIQYTGSFHNVAGMYDANSHTASLYLDGAVVAQVTASLGPIFTNRIFCVASSSVASFYNFTGSLDEVRVYLTASEALLCKNYYRDIYSENYLALYYKFNEGIVDDSSVDQVIVDYSKNSLHGKYVNYISGSRTIGTTMLEDWGDPILYSFHSSVVAFTSSLINSASYYDKHNNNLIFNLIPEGVRREDESADNLLKAFSLGIARFFDELKLYIDQFDNLRVTNYDNLNETPDLFLPYVQRYFGWKVSEQFGSADPAAFFFGENVLPSGSLNISLLEIRNQFWRRILNNLPYLLKTKGKRQNLDAYFNTLGINKENINIKEYGYLPGGSFEDTRIHKEKVISLLGFGTGSDSTLSASVVCVPAPTFTTSSYTVEFLAQLPFPSASYSASFVLGNIWQFYDSSTSESFALMWSRPTIISTEGTLILTGTDGQSFSSSLLPIFDGDMVNVAAGRNSDGTGFISVRTVDNDRIDYSASFVSSIPLDGVFTASYAGLNSKFIIGYPQSYFENVVQGFYGEVRIWSRALTNIELDSHALHFENIGTIDPIELPCPLLAHWSLGENRIVESGGTITAIPDISRNGHTATGSLFPVGENPYQKFLYEYDYLSPVFDLKWTENKVRIRNKKELVLSDVATDTNEVSLEFNLIDALNRDITKIFATFDVLNNVIGQPINKYRDEYSDLESLRRRYFQRLRDSINFTDFFKLFEWFDKKLSDSIKQMLPSRVNFIGGEQVVESHMLERPKYTYRYSVFHTPQQPQEAYISGVFNFSGDKEKIFEARKSIIGTYPASQLENQRRFAGNISAFVEPRLSSIDSQADMSSRFVSTFCDGEEIYSRSKTILDHFVYYSNNVAITAHSWSYGDGATSMIINNSGNIYAGMCQSGAWCVAKTNIFNTSSWQIIDGIQGVTDNLYNKPYQSSVYGISVDSSGALYAVGSIFTSGSRVWLVRKSHISSSASWNTVDYATASCNSAGSVIASAQCVYIDENDSIYVGGALASGSDSRSAPIIRKSINYGVTGSWNIIFTGSAEKDRPYGGIVVAITKDNINNFYCVSYEGPSQIQAQSGRLFRGVWKTYLSGNDTNGWFEIDSYMNALKGGRPYCIVVDDLKNIYVGGMAIFFTGSGQIAVPIIRRKLSGENFWKTIDMSTILPKEPLLTNVQVGYGNQTGVYKLLYSQNILYALIAEKTDYVTRSAYKYTIRESRDQGESWNIIWNTSYYSAVPGIPLSSSLRSDVGIICTNPIFPNNISMIVSDYDGINRTRYGYFTRYKRFLNTDKGALYRKILNGNDIENRNNRDVDINSKNLIARKILEKKDQENK